MKKETINPLENQASAESWYPDQSSFRQEYGELLPLRTHVVRELEKVIEKAMASLPSVPRVTGRVKSFDSYLRKYLRHLKERVAPTEITDLIGIRIICSFLEDLTRVEKLLREKFTIIEVERKGGGHTLREFGYDSIHLLITIPEEILSDDVLKSTGSADCKVAEIQVRTIVQDAWAEVEHELMYKTEFTPFDTPLKRKLAAVNASLSLADIVFQEIRNYQRELNGEFGKRKNSFFRKIEDFTDAVLFAKPAVALVQDDRLPPQTDDVPAAAPAVADTTESIDELLLEALHAHNKNQFPEAIAIYTRILGMKPVNNIRAIIYKHRGMAYFACSRYEKAISDFSESLVLDPKSYKSAYYKGIVCSVLKRHAQALDAFNQSLAIYPYQPYCLYRRGHVYYHLGDLPQALGDCEAALEMESVEIFEQFKSLLLEKLKM